MMIGGCGSLHSFPTCAHTHTHSSCTSNPLPEIESRVQALSEHFLKDAPLKEGPSQFAELRLHLSVSLYYKLLAAIVRDEENKNPDIGQLQTMLEYELLHKSLFALCVEIVLFSYNSQSRSATLVLHDGHMAIT